MTSPVPNGGRSKPRKSNVQDGAKGLWSSMLDNAASGKRLAEKQLLVLGGNADSQKAFLDALSQDTTQTRRHKDRHPSKKPPLANKFALGYTYQDILDADHDDILARLSVYLLADPHPAFSRLLDPLFAAKKIPETLVVILLDWSSPWSWLRQLCDWIRLLRSVLQRLDADSNEAMDDNMKEWSERRKGVPIEGATASNNAESTTAPTLGPGEWDEALGVPLCVVCQDAEKIEIFEREHGWKDDEFDFILQHMRTVLLKHGGSLIYTASAAPGQLQTLVRSSLGIQSLLQKSTVKHNVVDRDKVCVPPNWDSWGKIRVLKEGFDAESVSESWSVDIDKPVHDPGEQPPPFQQNGAQNNISAVSMYESNVKDPNVYDDAAMTFGSKDAEGAVEVECPENQEFFSTQLQTLDKMRVQDEADQKARDAKRPNGTAGANPSTPRRGDTEATPLSEQIGPVQMNMGGIHVNADDMLKGLREKQDKSPGADVNGQSGASSTAFPNTPGEGKSENEKLANFFAGLMSRGTPSGSPKPSTSPRIA